MSLFRRNKNARQPVSRMNYGDNMARRRPPKRASHDKQQPYNGNYSYYNSRSVNQVNTGRLDHSQDSTGKNSRLRWLWRHSLILISVLVIIGCVIDELLVSANVKVAVLGNNNQTGIILRDTGQYARAADKLISASLANQNKLTINTASISKSMEREFPELSDVSVVLPVLGNRPKIYIEAYKPALVLMTNGGVFVVNKSGKAIARVPDQEARQLKAPLVTDKSSLTIQVGAQVLSSDDGSFISYVSTELQNAGFSISKIILPAGREVDVYFQGKSYYAKFNLEHNNPRQQAGAFIATAKQLGRENKTPRKYIDVRLDGRAYYK